MSLRSAKSLRERAPFRGLLVALCAACTAACGSSTPRQASVAAPTVIAPAPTASSASVGSTATAASSKSSASSAATPSAASANAKNAAPAQGKRDGRREDKRRAAEAAADPGAPAPIPDAAQAGYDRAVAAVRGGDWLQAEIELEGLAADYPSYPGPLVNLAIVYAHGGRGDEARAVLERALAIDPGHAAANNQLGILLREQGKFDEAEKAYRRALETDPNYALAHYNLGVLLDVYLRRGSEAIEHYEAYQASLGEPDKTVAGWLIDLRRRVNGASAPQVAKENGE